MIRMHLSLARVVARPARAKAYAVKARFAEVRFAEARFALVRFAEARFAFRPSRSSEICTRLTVDKAI